MMPAKPELPTVFVVDDDSNMRESLSALLEALQFKVRGFPSAESFHRFYQPEMPGILLLDVQMPVQSGLQLYETLLQEGKRLPVIFITAHADAVTRARVLERGAVDFLPKPFSDEAMLDAVARAVRRRDPDGMT